MCGRFVRGYTVAQLAAYFDVDEVRTDLDPSWNVAPTQDVTVLRRTGDGDRVLSAMRWGLVPHWSDGPDTKYAMINARAETAHDKPAYRGPFRSRRCAVLADGFYEWRPDPDGPKTPIHVRRADGDPFAFAGLWDRWTGGDDGRKITSCTILTMDANAFMEPIHDRMPVIVDGDRLEAWTDPGLDEVEEIRALLDPWDGAGWEADVVSTEVNAPGNDGPRLVDPVG